MYYGFHKNIKQPNCYIDTDKKCFLSTRSAYSIDFWRITKDWSNDWSKISFVITGINYILKCILKAKPFFFFYCNNISQYYCI